jgi:hypothetical protein
VHFIDLRLSQIQSPHLLVYNTSACSPARANQLITVRSSNPKAATIALYGQPQATSVTTHITTCSLVRKP